MRYFESRFPCFQRLCVQIISQSSFYDVQMRRVCVYGSICVAGVFPVNLLFPTNLWEFLDELWEREVAPLVLRRCGGLKGTS